MPLKKRKPRYVAPPKSKKRRIVRAKIGGKYIVDVGESMYDQYGVATILLTPKELKRAVSRSKKTMSRLWKEKKERYK